MMTIDGDISILENSKKKLNEIIDNTNLTSAPVTVLVKTLSSEEAIGTPGRRDFPIVTGKERVVEAEFQGAKAHAFTDSPKEFIGKLQEVITMPLATNGERAIFIATMNAVLKHLNIVQTTLHCKDEEPEKCAKEIASHIKQALRSKRVGLVGLNPAILEALSNTFGAENVKITDLNRQNIGTMKYGVEVWDGGIMTEELVNNSDLVLMTGTTFVNGTFDAILDYVRHFNKEYLVYGVTSAGICE
ncbi:MAG: DUF364 domain-containing protein, partial [Proteobacteria bacterium]|nr:DUF364 domain-containing protein [Pseudomonadota bacterium]